MVKHLVHTQKKRVRISSPLLKKMENLEKELKTAIEKHNTKEILRLRADVIQKFGLGIWLGMYSKLDIHGFHKKRKPKGV